MEVVIADGNRQVKHQEMGLVRQQGTDRSLMNEAVGRLMEGTVWAVVSR